MHDTEPRQVPPRRIEQIDQLILDLHCALNRKRMKIANACSQASGPQPMPACDALRAEALWQQEQALNLHLRQALQKIVDASESGTAPQAAVARIGCLARTALAHGQHTGP